MYVFSHIYKIHELLILKKLSPAMERSRSQVGSFLDKMKTLDFGVREMV